MNWPANKLKRKTYVEKLKQALHSEKEIIYADESNVNLLCRRRIGQTSKGTRARQFCSGFKDPSLHKIAGVSTREIHNFVTKRGSSTNDATEQWFRCLIQDVNQSGIQYLSNTCWLAVPQMDPRIHQRLHSCHCFTIFSMLQSQISLHLFVRIWVIFISFIEFFRLALSITWWRQQAGSGYANCTFDHKQLKLVSTVSLSAQLPQTNFQLPNKDVCTWLH